ncbi:MAG: PadR family transcriptional regulator [Candidatus Bathyarchaeia archaeon]
MPKRYLCNQVPEILNEKPLSSLEIMNENAIERGTSRSWRPSPGSVYPLLAWLQDHGYVKEVSAHENGIKRYMLTDKGKQLLEELRKLNGLFGNGWKIFAPPFLGTLWLHIPSEEVEELRTAVSRLVKSLPEPRHGFGGKVFKASLKKTLRLLNETAQIEEIDRKMLG